MSLMKDIDFNSMSIDELFDFLSNGSDLGDATHDHNSFDCMSDDDLFSYLRTHPIMERTTTTTESEGGRQACPDCNRTLATTASLRQHREKYCRYREGRRAPRPAARVRLNAVSVTDDIEFDSERSCLRRKHVGLNGRVRDYDLIPNERVVDVERWLSAEESLVRRLYDALDDYVIKGRMVMRAWFVKINPHNGEVVRRVLFYLPSLSASLIHDFQHWYEMHSRGLLKHVDSFHNMDSDLVLDCIEAIEFKFSLLDNLNAESFFKLPDSLERKQAVVNVNSPTACFKYALLSMLHYSEVKINRNRVSQYAAWEDELDFGDVDVNKVDLRKDIAKVEDLNNIQVNVRAWEGSKLTGCRYNRRNALFKKTINLLLVVNSDGERHYCGIPSLSRLYRHTKTSGNMQHMCDRCIRSFSSKEHLTEHYQWCSRGRLQIERMPKNTKFSFTQSEQELSPLKVMYADIESYIKDDVHYPAAVASYNVWHKQLSHKQTNTKIQTWVGDDSITHFLQNIEDTVMQQHLHDNKLTRMGMILTTQQQKEFDACTACPRCNKAFDANKHKKVKDHCHITGTYRSPLCHTCNIRLRLKRRILPIIFHNFKCYDAHIIIKNGLGKFKHWKIDVIAQTKEKYMSLKVGIPVDKTKEGKNVFFNVVFLDSFQFMTSSLASLVKKPGRVAFDRTPQGRVS